MLRGIIVLLAGLALVPTAARASPLQESVFEDDDLLLHASDETVDGTMAELASLGVDRVRLPALWRDLAGDPGLYPEERFASLDRAIDSASAHGLAVLVNVRGGAPDWAQAPRPPALATRDAYKPSPPAFGDFVATLGRRYPQVDAWSLWNEPNWHALLQPQSVHGRPVAPGIYRRLYRAGTAALQASGHGADVILLGETAPLGSDRLGPERPLLAGRFYRELFCLNRRLTPRRGCGDYKRNGPLVATGVAHHPYPVIARPELRSRERGAIRLADGRRLTRILDAAQRYRRIGGKLPLWYTEFGYQTKPPDPYRGVSLARQANWNVRAEHVAYRDRRVIAFDQFLLRDSGPQTQYPASDRRFWSTYQTGLRFEDGREKPALAAYRLPLERVGRHRLWGMVRPGAYGEPQTVRLERRPGPKAPWQAAGEKTVANPRGYFTARARRGGDYRFVWLSPDGEVASRPAVTR